MLRIWWCPNFPAVPFRRMVSSLQEARAFLSLLTDYDTHLSTFIKRNTGGLEIFNAEDGLWEEWYDDSGRDIWETDTL